MGARAKRLIYLLKRLAFRVKQDGFKTLLKEFIFFNRKMIVVEKEISKQQGVSDKEIEFSVIDRGNYKIYINRNNLENVGYYCGIGCECIAAFRNGALLGFQWITQDNSFRDLKKLNLQLKKNEAYLFDFFVLPDHRGTQVPKAITFEAYDYLSRKGVRKVYGFFFSDNLKALWWHRAIMKYREIGRVKIHRMLVLEIVNGKIMLNI